MTTGTRPGVHQFGLIFDDNAWPLLYVRFPSKPLSDEGFEYFIERYTATGYTPEISLIYEICIKFSQDYDQPASASCFCM